ncbi:MAG TPA: hypothetical protein PLR95_07510, partial [Paludibacteraceae bacterium]|nr:hypothetical protein [Paludibacteraceae bacterium]
MAIIQNASNLKVYKGSRKPVNLYYGSNKVKGWHNITATTFPATLQTTYNDTADVVVKGNTVQQSEWVHKQGLSTQDGTPTPEAPIPIVSNLPAGTYKTKDWKGDWWEFTLTEDLCGIGDERDSVEWDRIGHNGFVQSKCKKRILIGTETFMIFIAYEDRVKAYITEPWGMQSYTGIMLSNYFIWNGNAVSTSNPPGKFSFNENTLNFALPASLGITTLVEFKDWFAARYAEGNPVEIAYQLATPTRTPLTFTKNNSSTAPECPMTFLTSTPSLEYPAGVYDASGTVKVRGKNLLYKSLIVGYYDNTTLTVAPFYRSFASDVFLPSGTYTFSRPEGNIHIVRIRLNNVTTKIARVNKHTFTLHEPTLVNFSWRNGIGAAWEYGESTTSAQLQLESGTVATPYEPYRPEVTATIPTLRKVGEVADEFNPKTGVVTRRINPWANITGANTLT